MTRAQCDRCTFAYDVQRAILLPFAVITCVMAMHTLIGCERTDALAPPAIRYGEDECAVCRMIISDDRYAAAIVALDDRDRHVKLAFDDIGCIFEYELSQNHPRILARYVKDMRTAEWLDLNSAELVHSRHLHTPMAFGVAAAATLDDARIIHNEFGGEFITIDEARRRYRLGLLHISSLDGRSLTPVPLEPEQTIRLTDGRDLTLTLLIPQQVPVGKHEFLIAARLNDASTLAPVTSVSLHIEPEMPSMGHGSAGNVQPQHETGAEPGTFRGIVNFTMTGYWLVHIEVRSANEVLGRASFPFEVSR